MLTIFTIPRYFRGHFGVIQRNAIRSWSRLHPKCEILLLGNDEGTAEMALELKISHVKDIACNEFGTPLINSAFEAAQNISKHRIVAYVNADIILMSDFMEAVQKVKRPSFLMVGERCDTNINFELDFTERNWESQLRAAARRGIFHGKGGIDYFVFNKGLFRNIPPFAIGRTTWDNWLVYRARALGVPVIDAIGAILAIHQNHDYSHCLIKEGGAWKGPEAKRNFELTGGSKYHFDIGDVTYTLGKNGPKPALGLAHIWRRLYRLDVFYPSLVWLRHLLDFVLRISRSLREGPVPKKTVVR